MGVSTKIAVQAEHSDPLAHFFAEFLDEVTFAEFRKIERLFGSLRETGSTIAGYPMIRPRDCAQITITLKSIFETCQEQFRRHDGAITERFEALIGTFHDYCRKLYPGEATAVLLLHADVLLFLGEAQKVVEMVSPLAMRPYGVENNLTHCAELVEMLGQAHLRLGTVDQLPISFIAFGAWLVARKRGISPGKAAIMMAPFVNFEPADPDAALQSRLIQSASRGYLSARRERNGVLHRAAHFLLAGFFLAVLCACYVFLARKARRSGPFTLKMNAAGPILVTRAMGGIGDLLTMQPGLEVLAKTHRGSVTFAIPRKFHAIFNGDPNIDLIDIEGPVIDISQYSAFYDLSLCPAARYESRRRPNVDRGRVELFARGMGVTARQLRGQGWHINRFGNDAEQAFCDGFLARHDLGKRPLIGVQPYSRDSYKDHTAIHAIIADLAKTYDIIIFHHVADGLPQGPGMASTAGLKLGDSLALVSRLQAMVSVDSAFLHAAGAYDVPVIGLFGPTGAQVITRHHRNATILWKPQTFGCVPCWRNEDLPCHVTGSISSSPCIAAITSAEVSAAVADALERAR